MTDKYVSFFKYENPIFSKKNVTLEELVMETEKLLGTAKFARNEFLVAEINELKDALVASDKHTAAALQGFYARLQNVRLF